MERLKYLPLWWYCLMAALCGVLGYQAWAGYREYTIEKALANPSAIIVDEYTPAVLVFTKARYLDQTGNSGEAIRLYASLRNTGNQELQVKALYNLATLYLKDAAQRWNARGVLDAAHVGTEIELAKENYREALRLQPGNWAARFNLEYAFRITPPPKEKAKADFQGSKSSVFSTLPGLPGGGP
jgi:mxaK protein